MAPKQTGRGQSTQEPEARAGPIHLEAGVSRRCPARHSSVTVRITTVRSLNVGRAIAWRWVEGVTTLTKENPSRPALADYVVPVTLSPADCSSQRSRDYFEYWSA